MWLTAACTAAKTARTLTANIRSKSASSYSSMDIEAERIGGTAWRSAGIGRRMLRTEGAP
jgi:hypothetical protein